MAPDSYKKPYDRKVSRGVNWNRGANKVIQTAQVSELCKSRLLGYADSIQELARSYDLEFRTVEDEPCDRQMVLAERRLWENRQIISGHLNEVAKIMAETACETVTMVPMEARTQRRLIKQLAEEGIRAENPCFFLQNNGRQAVTLTMRTQRGERRAAGEAADMISVLLDKRLQMSTGSPYAIESAPHSFILEEEAEFLVLTGFARAIKEDETVSGDNYAVTTVERGRMTVMLSDGTGSGEKAGRESEQVLDLTEKMLEAGYETNVAIRMINAALFAVGEDDNHPTLDVCEIDMYQGSCRFWKVGGAASFLKRSGDVQMIASNSLPLGIFPQAEVKPVCRKLEDGDYLVMLSDGVVDAFEQENYESVISEVIRGISDSNPEEFADRLLRTALRASGGRIRDDMTVGVIGIWENR